jgi:HEPN domain-containing protein
MNATPQIAFNRSYEPCVYATRGKPYLSPDLRNLTEVLDKEVGVGNRVLEDIIDLFDLWLAKRLGSAEYEHPTEKPPTLHEKPLKRCTQVSDIVLDLFG